MSSDDFLSYFENEAYDTAELVKEAHGIIEKHRQRLQTKEGSRGRKLDKLLDAMLDHAPTPFGARYMAVALHVAATKEDGGHSVVEAAKAWLDQLLLPSASIPPSKLTSDHDFSVSHLC